MSIEEYAMENGISLAEAQKQLEQPEVEQEREPPKKQRPKKAVDE